MKKRILWISDSPELPTGNGKISKHFIEGLNKTGDYEIAVLGRGYTGWPNESEKHNCLIFPMDIGRPYPEVMKIISSEFQPQVVISCLDMWQIDWMEHAKLSKATTNIGYISIYGTPVPYSWKNIVKNLDLAICYSEFGRLVLKEFMPFSSFDMIHLGVDTDLYRPMDNRGELKKKKGLDGKFVVGCIARNQLRKRLDKLVEGFAKFAKGCETAHLYLRSEPVTDHGYDLPDLLNYYGIADQVTLSTSKGRKAFTEENLVELYNVFDVYAQSAGAEGFGLPILEAMSCGVPVIAPDYSSCSELVDVNGILLKPYYHRIVDMACVEQVSINTDELAEGLSELYHNKEKRIGMSEKGRAFAQNLTWNHFTERWLDVLSKVRWE